MASGTNAKPAQGKSQTYFVDQKKGEVNELKNLLRNISVERDPTKKRDVIKKVIAYMTLGYDVSTLFGEMVMASSTTDIILKKMCYLYLSNYASSNEELATLVINTMTKDCRDADPMIRGLALRSLSSLRLASTVEYLLPVLQSGLTDSYPYVRRNAVMAVLKVHHLRPDIVHEGDMVNKLYDMVRDSDPQVVASSLMALSEIMMEEGGVAVNRNIIHHLLNQIKEFNEWGQCIVLNLVAKYRPEDAEETFSIMNILDGCLRVTNSAVVLGTTKCFLQYAESVEGIREQVFLRLKQPMLTLMASANHEIRYAVLKHVSLMVSRCPGIFDDEFKQFYCHYNEPVHVKLSKLDILPELTNERNVTALVQELSEYVGDVDQTIAKKSLKAIGRMAVKIPAGADSIINILLEFIEMDIDYVRSGVVCAVKDLLRKYPDRAVDVLPSLPRCAKRVDDAEGKAAVVFMVGEYGASMREAPYILEKLIDNYDEETSVLVKSTLLLSTAKLFFKRAPECEGMFARLLQAMLNDTSDTDLHDRALLYYRLLSTGVPHAANVIAFQKQRVGSFIEERDITLKQKLFEEFNTLSVLYQKPSELFIDPQHREVTSYHKFQDEHVDEEHEDTDVAQAAQVPAPTPDVQPVQDTGNLLDMGGDGSAEALVQTSPGDSSTGILLDSLLGGGEDHTAGTSPAWSLVGNATIDQNAYQSKWEGLEPGTSFTAHMLSIPEASAIENAVASRQIMCMASGDLGVQYKFYFFARDQAERYYFAEVIVEKGGSQLTATIKGEDANMLGNFEKELKAGVAEWVLS